MNKKRKVSLIDNDFIKIIVLLRIDFQNWIESFQ
jgi:hypothetical protein